MGVQLTAMRECTRDLEWKLLELTILDFESRVEVTFAAEQTAADAARIQATYNRQVQSSCPESALAPQTVLSQQLRHNDCSLMACQHARST